MKGTAANRLVPALASLVKPRPPPRQRCTGIGQQLTVYGSEAKQRRPRGVLATAHAAALRYVGAIAGARERLGYRRPASSTTSVPLFSSA